MTDIIPRTGTAGMLLLMHNTLFAKKEKKMKRKSAKQICIDGAALLDAGNVDAALSQFTEGLSVTKDPCERGTLYYNIAICHTRLKHNADAIAMLAETVKAYPRHLRTIRRATDFPELTKTPEFASFLKEATENRTGRLYWAIVYGVVWVVVLIIWRQLCDDFSRSGPNLHGIYLGPILISVACAVVIDIFRRLKRRHDTQANETLTQSISNPVAPVEKDNPDLVCPQCGRPYSLADYREDAEHIFCSDCEAELTRN